MIKAVLHQLDGNDQALQYFRDGLVGPNIGTKTVAAKQNIAGEQSVAFAFEEKAVGQRQDFIVARGEPFLEVALLASPLRESKIAADEFPAYNKTGVGGEHHVRKFLLRSNQFDATTERFERGLEPLPLLAGQGGKGVVRAAHPGIDFVLDAVIIRRAKQQAAHGASLMTNAQERNPKHNHPEVFLD